MSGKTATPVMVAKMVAMRSAGWTVAAIAQQIGASPATVNRYLIKHKTVKNSLTDQAIAQAQTELLAITTGDMAMRIGVVQNDDYALFIQLRDAIAISVDKLTQDKSLPSHYVLRGLAAAAVSMTATQAAIRKTLNMNDIPILQTDLPYLEIRELTAEDIATMKDQQFMIASETEGAPLRENSDDSYEEEMTNDLVLSE